MAVPIETLEVYQGKTHRERFRVVNENGEVFENISLWPKFWLTVKHKTTETDPGLFQLTLAAGLTIIDGPNGILEALFLASHTSDASLVGRTTELVWDLAGLDPSSRPWELMTGPFTLKTGTTRAVS